MKKFFFLLTLSIFFINVSAQTSAKMIVVSVSDKPGNTTAGLTVDCSEGGSLELNYTSSYSGSYFQNTHSITKGTNNIVVGISQSPMGGTFHGGTYTIKDSNGNIIGGGTFNFVTVWV